ncbi:MAG: dihydrolipoamide acetyltransferase family protein [Planctomycetota bacterium]
MGLFRMPSLGADMEEGTLVEWLAKPGDEVHHGDVIARVETAKGVVDVDCFENGTFHRALVEEDATVPVGTPLAVILAPGETEAAVTTAAAPAPAAPAPVSRRRASPAARKLAQEHGLDIDSITAEGAAVSLADVERAIAGTSSPPAEVSPKPVGDMRSAIASAMSRSKREIPHYYLAHTIDLTAALTWLEQVNAARPPTTRLLPGVLPLKAVAKALEKFGEFNGHYMAANGFRRSDAIHVGMAVALRTGGLIAPAIHRTNELSLDELMEKLRDLTGRARNGGLRGSELADPTITVTSLGDRGVEALFAIIHPPQVAIVGVGKVVERPWVVEGRVEPRRVVTVSLGADHRVTDGHLGGRFLAHIDKLLQQPEQL